MANAALAKSRQSGRQLTNTQIAIRTIKQMILENKLPAGSNHLESELAEKLGMSRTPVREATLILEAQGLLEIRPRHGVKILALSISDMHEIYQILTELEGLAAELAARRNYNEQEFKLAEQAISDIKAALARDNREAWAEADEVFHSELIRLGGNKRVATIVKTCNDQVRRARALTLYMRPSPTQSNEDHRRVLDAIKSGDPEKARTMHRAHLLEARGLLVSILERHKLHVV